MDHDFVNGHDPRLGKTGPGARAGGQPWAGFGRAAANYGRLSKTARLLIACRAERSLGQGALVADFALYLSALHWSAFEMGLVYAGGLLVGAAFTLLAAPASDRIGRKPFLLGYSVVQALAALAALASGRPTWLVPAAVAGAFGRGANGAAGPFGPVEQAWLSADLRPADYGPVYSLNAAVGYGGMGAGAALGVLPALWRQWLPGALAYRPLFLLVRLGALLSLVLLCRMRDTQGPLTGGRDTRAARVDPRGEWGLLLRLMGINALNGLGIGMIGPFMALWFALRFREGPGAIAPVIAAGFLLAMASAVGTGWLTQRLGRVRAVVMMRAAGLLLLILLPFAPSYGLAAACYMVRAACNRGTSGARQAVGLRLVGAGRRGLAASLNSSSTQIPRALSPTIGGLLLDAHLLVLPLLLAALLQAAYVVLYGTTFRSVE